MTRNGLLYLEIVLYHNLLNSGVSPPLIILNEGQQSFSGKGQVVNIFGFVGHTDSQNYSALLL